MSTVLVVDPDRSYSELIRSGIGDKVHVSVVRSAQAAIDWLDAPNRICDLVVFELALGEHSGVEIIHELRSHSDWLQLPLVIHSRVPRIDGLSDKVLKTDYGVIGYIQKGPNSIKELQTLVSAVAA